MRMIRRFTLALMTASLGCAGHTRRTAARAAPAEVPLPTPPKIIPNVRLAGDTNAARAIAAVAATDPCWAIRAQALHALTAFAEVPAMRSTVLPTVLAAVRDSDSRIRQSAVAALASFPGDATDAVLVSEARSDASPIVRGIALASYLRVAGDSALPLAREVMAEQSWRNVLRTPAVAVLKGMPGAAARALYEMYAKK
jgi:hypothetical protein